MEKNTLIGIRLPESMVARIQKLADKKYEGNFSMALRSLITKSSNKVGENKL